MSKKILLVEDEAILAMNEAKMLEKHGYSVVTAYKGEKAVEIVEEDPDISLILMDIDLGKGMDGTETAHSILAHHEIPIVFLTSHSEKEMVDKVKGITRYGYVLKNAGEFVLLESITMAYELFNSNNSLKKENEERLRVEKIRDEYYRHLSSTFSAVDSLLALVDKNYRIILSNWKDHEWMPEKKRLEESPYCYEAFKGFDSPCEECPTMQTFEDGKYRQYEDRNPINGNYKKISIIPIFSDNGEVDYVLENVQDITEQKQLENQLREEEQELTAIYEHTPVLMLLLDKERRVRKANAFATQFAGTPAEEMIGKRGGEALRCLHHLDDPQGCGFSPFCKECTVKRTVEHTFANGKEYQRAEATLPFIQDGKEQQLTFLVSTSLLHKEEEDLCLVAFEDITDYKRLQNKYKELFENAPLPYQSLDKNGTFLEVNPAWLKTLGYTREEVIGKNFAEFLYVNSVEDFTHNLKNFKEKGTAIDNLYKMLKKNGDYIDVSYNGNVAYTSDGQFKQTHCIFKDITEESRMQAKLDESEKKYRTIVDNINDSLIIHNFEGVITFANDNTYRMLNYIQDELIGKSVVSLYSYAHRDFIKNIIQKNAWPDGEVHEIEALSKDDKIIPVEVSSKIVSREGAGEIQSVVRDITERKQTEEALRKSEEKNSAILHALPDPMFILDNTGTYLDYYASNKDDLYIQPERFIGQNMQDILPQEVYEHLFFLIEKTLSTKEVQIGEYELTISGERRAYEARFSPYDADKVVAITRDITESKLADEALQNNRNLLDATQKIAKVGGWEWDVIRQTMTWADQTYLIHGFDPGEFVAGSPEHIQRSLACYDPDDRPKIEEAFRKCVEEGVDYTLELPLTTSQGRLIWVQTSAQAVWENGKVVKVQGHIMDITERKQAEEQLRETLKEKEFLMRELNHRVKNNLHMVSSLISLKDMEIDYDLSDLKHRIEAIRLVHEKLHQYGEVEQIKANEYIQEILESVFSSFSAQKVTIDNNIEEVNIHPRTLVPLGIVINEIATNAIKYGFTSEEARFSVNMKKDAESKHYILTLSNTGNPFPEEIGLENPETMGLQLISSLVAQLNGTVELQKNPNPVFTIRFPIEEE